MGYACPVCETPQADAGHLANHLAFTALARGGDHEAWLDEHVPGWADLGEDRLAERVVDDAKAVEYPQMFEDATGDATAEPTESGTPVENAPAVGDLPDDGEDVESVFEAARELTRRRREGAETDREPGSRERSETDEQSETE